jgi:ketosteroid isomerase-like protein
MRCFGLAPSAVLLTVWISSCSHNPVDDEQNLRKAMEQRQDAFQRGDADGYARLTAKDLVIVDDDGAYRTKSSILDQIRKGESGPTPKTINDLHVKIAGDIDILAYHVEKEEKFGNQTIKSETRDLETYERQAGRWVLVSRAIVPIPNPHRTPAKIDSSVYSHYAGVYDFGDKFLVTVEKDADKLLSFNTEDKTPVVLLPFSEVSFYQDRSTGVLTFIRDKQGKVVALEIWDGNSTVTGRKIS